MKKEIRSRLKNIRILVTDVDGVLTDGRIIFDEAGIESKEFNVKDGLILKYLHQAEILSGVITGRDSKVVRKRCEELNFSFHFHGIKDKMEVLEKELSERNIDWSEVAYIGDDINDLMLLGRCAVGVCPSDAPSYIKKYADIIVHAKGGEGVFREIADHILESKGLLKSIIKENTYNEN